jgi:hypothetical protein
MTDRTDRDEAGLGSKVLTRIVGQMGLGGHGRGGDEGEVTVREEQQRLLRREILQYCTKLRSEEEESDPVIGGTSLIGRVYEKSP